MLLIEDESIEYSWALKVQETLVQAKKARVDLPDLLWLLSHPPVFTLGAKKSSRANVINPGPIPVIEISRGGDVTYHDEGQIVGYLIMNLNSSDRDLHKVLNQLEEVIIRALWEFNVTGYRVPGKTGVFVEEHKVCSIGIACRHWITYHGFALNLNSNLNNYQRINPCGLNSDLMQNLKMDPLQRKSLEQKIFWHTKSIFHKDRLKNEFTDIKAFLETYSIPYPA